MADMEKSSTMNALSFYHPLNLVLAYGTYLSAQSSHLSYKSNL